MDHTSFLKNCYSQNIEIIPYSDIQFENYVGSGASAEVWASKINGKNCITKEYHPYDNMDDLRDAVFHELTVCNLFKGVRGIIQLKGIATKYKSRYFIIFHEVLCIGDLYSYLEYPCFYINDKYTVKHSLKRLMIISLINAVQSIHNKNIVHCDLKPENILFGKRQITIIDFGASTIMGDSKIIDGSNQWTLGTVGYMSPELHEHKIYYESDIYSIGVIIIYIWVTIDWGDTNTFDESRKCVLTSLKKIDDPLIYTIAKDCISIDISKRPSLQTILNKITSQ